MIYLSTPEFQVEWKVVPANKIMFSDEICKQNIRWTKQSPPSSHLFTLRTKTSLFPERILHFLAQFLTLFYAIYTTSVLSKVMLRIQFVCVLSAAVWIEQKERRHLLLCNTQLSAPKNLVREPKSLSIEAFVL